MIEKNVVNVVINIIKHLRISQIHLTGIYCLKHFLTVPSICHKNR